MTRRAQCNTLLGMVSATCLLILPGIAHAQVSAPVVTLLGNGLYHYDYSITNTSADDLFDVDIQVMPGAGVVTNVSAPVGFMTAYDSGLGLVSYLEDTSLFTAAPLSGFTYDSGLAPMTSTFNANFAPLAGGITTTTGSTVAAVPEPGSIALFASMGAVAGFAARRKRRK